MAMVSNRYEQVNLPLIIDLKHDHNIIPEEDEEDEEEDEEEEEEEIINDYENLVNEEYNEEEDEDEEDEEEYDENYYLEENTRGYLDEYETTTAINDDPFYLANRTFYTTCHKISRQNSPSYRKRPPYTFLENWLIHSVFSKSQQILLRFPVIHPKVMMTEGDFIYTPHQMANENQQDPNIDQQQQQLQQQQEEEEDYDYYDDAFVIGDEGVLVMSASAPDASQFMAQDDDEEEDEENGRKRNSEKMNSIVMDENMWMGHSRYNTNGLTLHVVNPDEEEEEDEDDPMYHSVTSTNNPYKSIISHNSYQGKPLQMVKEEDEEEEEEEEDITESESESESDIEEEEDLKSKLSMSPQVLSWYRSAETTNNRSILEDNKPLNEESSKNLLNCGCSTSSNSSTTSTCSNNSTNHQQRTDFIRTTNTTTDEVEKTVTRRSSESYQSLADIIEEEQQLRDYGTLPTYRNRSIMTSKKKVSALMQVSDCFVDAAWVAMDIAQSYADSSNENKTVATFVHSLFKIWKSLFLGTETMLGWGNHRLKPQAMV